ncbi:MAG: antitoxin VapB family protein [Bacteroidales bacterium]
MPTIRISEEVKRELDKDGCFKESYNDIIKRLIKTIDNMQK